MTNEIPKWYIATTVIGTEDIVYKNIEDKIRAYGLNDLVKEIKLLKSKEVMIEVFDNKNNPPPKLMRNTKSITWETLPGNKYKKTRIREVNTFPGYIYIKMIMTQEAWYAIRNTYGITGFVGSSGKGAQPIPMSDTEVEELFMNAKNNEIIINKSDSFSQTYIDSTSVEKENQQNKKESNVEFLYTPEILSVSNKPLVIEQPMDEIKEVYLSPNDKIESFEENEKINKIKVGSFVKIATESMKDSIGVVKEIDINKNQIHVEIDLLGNKSIVILNPNEFEIDY